MEKIKIFLTKGSGEGLTKEAAYCQALKRAGLINLNLITLSSVLPHNCEIVEQKPKFSYEDYGKKLYAIVSETRLFQPDKPICAGLGWMVEEGGSGNGLVVQAAGESKKEVARRIEESLDAVAKNAEEKYKKIKVVTEEIICKDKPVCALVALAFKLEGWF